MRKNNLRLKAILKNTFWLLIYVTVIYAVSSWQQKDMLDTNEKLAVLELKLLDVSGEPFLYRFQNKKQDTLVYFFAPWCSVCHASIDNVESIKQAQWKNLSILIVALDWGSVEEVELFLEQHELSVPVLLGTRQVQRDFKISGFPSYYLIAPDGTIRTKSMGYSTELGMRAAISLYGSRQNQNTGGEHHIRLLSFHASKNGFLRH